MFGFRRFGAPLCTGAMLTLAAMAFLRPDAAARGAAAGLALCARSVVPALFPLLVASQLIVSSRAAAWFALPMRPYLRLLRVRGRAAASAMALGWLGGFACGAQSIGALYRAGALTRRDAEVLLCCTIGSGPAFVVSAVGAMMLHSASSGAVLLASLLAGNLVCGLAARLLLPAGDEAAPGAAAAPPGGGFVEAVRTSVQSMLTLCGFVVFFAFAAEVFLPEGADAAARWLVCLPLEVTNACAAAAGSGTPLRLYACCASLSAMGASVFFQVRSLVPDGVRLWPLAASRIVHLPVSLACARLLLRLFPAAAPAAAPARLWMPPDAATAVFLMLCVVLPCFPHLRRAENRV